MWFYDRFEYSFINFKTWLTRRTGYSGIQLAEVGWVCGTELCGKISVGHSRGSKTLLHMCAISTRSRGTNQMLHITSGGRRRRLFPRHSVPLYTVTATAMRESSVSKTISASFLCSLRLLFRYLWIAVERTFAHPVDFCQFTLTVRSTSLFKLEDQNRTRLVQKPNWTRFMGKSENVYSGTRTFWLFRDQTNRKSVYRSTHFHFCPWVSVQFGFCTNLVRFRFSSLNKLFARTAWGSKGTVLPIRVLVVLSYSTSTSTSPSPALLLSVLVRMFGANRIADDFIRLTSYK